jgi:hypothetical protein
MGDKTFSGGFTVEAKVFAFVLLSLSDVESAFRHPHGVCDMLRQLSSHGNDIEEEESVESSDREGICDQQGLNLLSNFNRFFGW